MDSIAEARALIKMRLEEVDRERAQLNRALSHLNVRGKATNNGRRTATAKSRRSNGRARRGQREAEFLAAITDHPGTRMADVAREMGVRPQQLYPIARRLSGSGAIKKSGRGYAVTAPADS